MTLPYSLRRAGPYSGTGVLVAFPFTFKVFAKTDISAQLTVNGVTTTLVQDSDYTVTLNTDQEATPGGDVQYTLAVGTTLTLLGSLPYDQPTDLPAGGAYRAQVVEDALDRIVIQTQQLAESADRSLRAPVGEVLATLPNKAARANTIQGYDANGDPSVAAPLSGTAADVLVQLADASNAARGDAQIAVQRVVTGAVATTQHRTNDDRDLSLLEFLTDAERADALAGAFTLDLTTKVQAAITALRPGQNLLMNGARCKITGTGLVANNKLDNWVFGPGELKCVNAADDCVLIKPTGTVQNFRVMGVKFTGDGLTADLKYQYGFWCPSGTGLQDVWLLYCDFSLLNAGVSFNADSSGTIKKVGCLYSTFTNMRGTEGGQGYGLHEANAEDFQFVGNVFDNCSRHDIYCARWSGSPKWVGKVTGNTSRNHRLTGFNPAFVRPAFYDVQGGVEWSENTIEDYYDGAFWCSPDTANGKSNFGSIFRHNRLRGRKNAVPSIVIGEQNNPTTQRQGRAEVTHNTITTNVTTAGGGEEVQVNNGLGVTVDHNDFVLTGIPAGTYRAIIIGAFAASVADIDQVSVRRNTLTGTATGTPVKFVRLGTTVCTGANVRCRIEDNDVEAAVLSELVEFVSTQTNTRCVVKPLGGKITGVYVAGTTNPSVYGGVEVLEVVNSVPTNITALTDITDGQEVTLHFGGAGATTVKHNTGDIRLAGGVDFVSAARNSLTLKRSKAFGQTLESGRALTV